MPGNDAMMCMWTNQNVFQIGAWLFMLNLKSFKNKLPSRSRSSNLIYISCHMVFLTCSNICPLWGAPAAWLKNLFLSRTSDRSHSLQAWVSTRTKKKSQQKLTSTGGYHMSGPCKVYVRGCPPQNHGLIWHCSSISGTLRWWFKFMDRFLSIKKGISPTTMGNYSCFTMAKLRQITYSNLFN